MFYYYNPFHAQAQEDLKRREAAAACVAAFGADLTGYEAWLKELQKSRESSLNKINDEIRRNEYKKRINTFISQQAAVKAGLLTPIDPPLSLSTQNAKLAAFGRDALKLISESKDWDKELVRSIAAAAVRHGLASCKPDGPQDFVVTDKP